MIISRTPFRISFLGGGTDYPQWFEEHGGAVIGTSIDKYCYITLRRLPPYFPERNKIVYSQMELTNSVDAIRHPSVRECLKAYNIADVEVYHHCDLPAKKGLGASSAFTVGLIHTIHALKGETISHDSLAKQAVWIEQGKIQETVGCQDQYLTSFGGFRHISFDTRHGVDIVDLSQYKQRLEPFLMLFDTFLWHNASQVAAEQMIMMNSKVTDYKELQSYVTDGIKCLESDDMKGFAKLLNLSWLIKRGLSRRITNSAIDELYEAGMKAGAMAGKLIGAGAGGYMLFLVEPDKHNLVKGALEHHAVSIPIKFEQTGSQIIYQGSA